MKYKEGDVVLLKDGRRPAQWHTGGRMDKYLGQYVTIDTIINDEQFRITDEVQWTFRFTNINSCKPRPLIYEIY